MFFLIAWALLLTAVGGPVWGVAQLRRPDGQRALAWLAVTAGSVCSLLLLLVAVVVVLLLSGVWTMQLF